MNILVVLNLSAAHKEELERAAPDAVFAYTTEEEVTEALLEWPEVIIGTPPARLLSRANRLRWLQLGSSGADAYVKPGILPKGVQLTTATGAFGVPLAEHLMGMLMFLCQQHAAYWDDQRQHRWEPKFSAKLLQGSRVLVVGLGDVGREFATRMQAMGTTVIGVRRSDRTAEDCVNELVMFDQLDTQLPLADVVALCLPSNAETRHLMNGERLARMKPDAVLLNVGRGDAIDTDALSRLMKEGHLWGAGLDVTEIEPLPASSPLWDTPNLLITPHAAGRDHVDYTLDVKVRIAASNLRHYLAGEPLANVVDFSTGYKQAGTGYPGSHRAAKQKYSE